jgi:MoxR-like ATPase
VREWRAQAHSIHIDDALKRYIVELVVVTREAQHPAIDYGASPRATLAIANLARAKALLERRDYAVPDDVRSVAPLALRHRIGFNFRVSNDGGATRVLESLIARVPVP